MVDAGIPRATFSFSPAAKEFILGAIREGSMRSPDDPIVATSIGWGIYFDNSGQSHDGIVVGFYNRSFLSQIAEALQTVSGLAVFFYVRPKDLARFDRKTIDYDKSKWLFALGARRSGRRMF